MAVGTTGRLQRIPGLARALVGLALVLPVACGGDDDDGAPGGAGGKVAGAGNGGTAGKGGTAGSGGIAGKGGAAGKGGTAGAGGSGGQAAGRAGGNGGAGGQGRGGASGSGGEGPAGDGGTSGSMTELGCQAVLSPSGEDTGFEQCDDGTKRRRVARRCPAPVVADHPVCPSTCTGSYCCEADSDCNQFIDKQNGDGPLAICANAHQLSGYCGCFFGCREDSDCGAGFVCECGSPLGQCRPATCHGNADCGAGSSCARTYTGDLYPGHGGAGAPGEGGAAGAGMCIAPYSGSRYDCETPADRCRGDDDCRYGTCVWVDGRRECVDVCAV
jgi:hypothetical protein